MLQILDLGSDTVFAYRIDGRIDRDDVERAFAAVDEKRDLPEKLRVYAEVHGMGMTLDALWRDIELSVRRIDLLRHIERAAVVTDVEWIRKAATVERKVFRNIDIRVYGLADQLRAQAWVLEPPAVT